MRTDDSTPRDERTLKTPNIRAHESHQRLHRPRWKPIAVVLVLLTLFTLEALFLRFGPSLPITAYGVVLALLGLLVIVAVIAELVSWMLFAESLTRFMGRRSANEKRPSNAGQPH
jgi:membrane protein implicated in regulation of membrane protease activity